MTNKKQYDEGYFHGAGSTQDQVRGARDAARDRQKRDQEFRDQLGAAYQQQQKREREQQREREQREQERLAQAQWRKANEQGLLRAREVAKIREIEANKRKVTETKQRIEKAIEKPKAPKLKKPPTKRDWSWGAAILAFFIGTGVGLKQIGLAQEAAFIFGGIVGIIFGFFYKQILILAIIGFIAYTILKNQ